VLCFGSADSKGVTGVFYRSADSKRVRSGSAGNEITDGEHGGRVPKREEKAGLRVNDMRDYSIKR
jgi:hypothetical protein